MWLSRRRAFGGDGEPMDGMIGKGGSFHQMEVGCVRSMQVPVSQDVIGYGCFWVWGKKRLTVGTGKMYVMNARLHLFPFGQREEERRESLFLVHSARDGIVGMALFWCQWFLDYWSQYCG
ncbi:hypothetical protein LIA77_07502 [Sarocladium implicatum]|nr:hypothetical protein LIA77_07502 [Sarocladium implicatum]